MSDKATSDGKETQQKGLSCDELLKVPIARFVKKTITPTATMMQTIRMMFRRQTRDASAHISNSGSID